MNKPATIELLLDNNLYSPEMIGILRGYADVLEALGIQTRYVETGQGFKEKTKGALFPDMLPFAGKGTGRRAYGSILEQHSGWLHFSWTSEDQTFEQALANTIATRAIPALWGGLSSRQQGAYQEKHPTFVPPKAIEVEMLHALTEITNLQRTAFRICRHLDNEHLVQSGVQQFNDIDVLTPAHLSGESDSLLSASLLQAYYKQYTRGGELHRIMSADPTFAAAHSNSADRSWECYVNEHVVKQEGVGETCIVCISDDGPAVDSFRRSIAGCGQDLGGVYLLSGTGFLLLLDRMAKHLALAESENAAGIVFGREANLNAMLEHDASSQFWQQSVVRDENAVNDSRFPSHLSDLTAELLTERLAVAAPSPTRKEDIRVKEKAKHLPPNPNYDEHKRMCAKLIAITHHVHTHASASIELVEDDETTKAILAELNADLSEPVSIIIQATEQFAAGVLALHGSARNAFYLWGSEAYRQVGDVDFKFFVDPMQSAYKYASDEIKLRIREQLEDEGFVDIEIHEETTRSGQIRRQKWQMAYVSDTGEKHAINMDVSFDNRVPYLMPIYLDKPREQDIGLPGNITLHNPYEMYANTLVAMIDARESSKARDAIARKQATKIFDAAFFTRAGILITDPILGLSMRDNAGLLFNVDNPIVRLRFVLEIAEKLARPSNAGAIDRMGIVDAGKTQRVLEELFAALPTARAENAERQARSDVEFYSRISEQLLRPLRAIRPGTGVKLKDVNTAEAEFVRAIQQGIVDPGWLFFPADRFRECKAPGWQKTQPRPSFREQMEQYFASHGRAEVLEAIDMDVFEKDLFERVQHSTLLFDRAKHYATRKGRDVVIVGYGQPPPGVARAR